MIKQLFEMIAQLESDLDEAYKELEERSPISANHDR